MRVAILGAGMAGMLAAKALQESGISCLLFDKNPQQGASNNVGVHYLHDPCGLELEPKIIRNYLIGCEDGCLPHEQYSEKLGTPLNNSLVDLPSYQVAYSFQEAHRLLRKRFEDKVIKLDIKPSTLFRLMKDCDKVISTIPLPILFDGAECLSVGARVARGKPYNLPDLPGHNKVVYNIDLEDNWYRYSNVFGVEWTEVKEGGEFFIKKIVSTDFVSPFEDLELLGRWGAWDRKFLAHDAYYETIRRLQLW